MPFTGGLHKRKGKKNYAPLSQGIPAEEPHVKLSQGCWQESREKSMRTQKGRGTVAYTAQSRRP